MFHVSAETETDPAREKKEIYVQRWGENKIPERFFLGNDVKRKRDMDQQNQESK